MQMITLSSDAVRTTIQDVFVDSLITVTYTSAPDVYVSVVVEHPVVGARQRSLIKGDKTRAPSGSIQLQLFRRESYDGKFNAVVKIEPRTQHSIT